jgi:hypothetical protein
VLTKVGIDPKQFLEKYDAHQLGQRAGEERPL